MPGHNASAAPRINMARLVIVARDWWLKISIAGPFCVQPCLFSILGIYLRIALRVRSPLEFISGNEALDGSTVKVKDGGCLPAVPAGLIEDELQVASLQLIHARPVRDPSLFDTAGTAWPVAGIRDFRREAVRCDEAV
jgi:hypothetical protein